jgi:thiamine-monophosphate kinase
MSYARTVNSKPSSSSATGELALLRSLRARAARHRSPALRLGIGDDCALLAARPGEEIAVTTDLSIAGRHFRLDWHPPEAVGHRALARGLSDLAAMGARPLAAFLSLAVPRELTRAARHGSWVDRFLTGLLDLSDKCKTPLAGGDLAESPLATADIVLIGAVKRGHALLRSGARPGDRLYVTGSLGSSAAGLQKLAAMGQDREQRAASRGQLPAAEGQKAANGKTPLTGLRIPTRLEPFLAAHLSPQPRLAQGLWLSRRGVATAALDISDGLATDLRHLCEESGVAAEILAEALPLGPGATLEQALYGGEDYELLFTAPEQAKLPRAMQGVAITPIGRIVKARKDQPRISLLNKNIRQPLTGNGWEHFSI